MRKQKDPNVTGNSTNWNNWQAVFDDRLCDDCHDAHGAIYAPKEIIKHLHFKDRCRLVPMRTKKAGTATKDGIAGVDKFLKFTGKLPPNYIDKNNARKNGWKSRKGNLDQVLPGRIIGGDIYHNDNKRLPEKSGRTWYEADLEYEKGFRSRDRILYSSDGLIFITKDHYETYYEIT